MNKYNPEQAKKKVRSSILIDALKAERENSIKDTARQSWNRKPYYMIVAAAGEK